MNAAHDSTLFYRDPAVRYCVLRAHESCSSIFLHDGEASEKPRPRDYMILTLAVNASVNKARGRINSVMNESNCLCYCVFICRFNIVCWTLK